MNKKSIKELIYNFLENSYDEYPFLPFYKIENYVLINKLHKYMIDNDKYCTLETVSRKWREIRRLSETRKINNKFCKILKFNNKELYAINKFKNDKIYDIWEFTKL